VAVDDDDKLFELNTGTTLMVRE